MTVHASKGLEFPYVFIVEMNEGIFPIKRTGTLEAMEERRLAFVVMTRAQKGLYISDANGRNFDGSPRYPSRFILDIDKSLLEFTHEPDDALIADAGYYIQSSERYMPETALNTAYETGHRVRHDIISEGTVIDIDLERNTYVIKFDALETPGAIAFKAKLAKL